MAKSKKYNGYLRKRFTINGKQYTVYGKTNDELYQKETEKRKQIEQGLNELYNPTLAQYYDHFTEIRKKEVKESTIRSQASQFKIASSGVVAKGITLGKMPIKEIKRKDIEKARQDLLKKNKTPQNLNNIFAHLNHVFNNAVLDDTIVKNPCKALPPLKRNTPLIGENKHRALTPEELKAFFEESANRNSYYDNLFKVMAKTGMRVGEVCALLPKDIDRKKGFIHVTRTVTRSETGSYMLGEDAKTKSGKRDIPLTHELVTIFEDQRRFNAAFFGISIDELEKRTGIDFFCNLPDQTEQKVEQSYAASVWGLR